MDITKVVAAIRFKCHANMLDINNVLNQLGIRKDEKAEEIGKHHCFECLDCLERLGLDPYGFIEKEDRGA